MSLYDPGLQPERTALAWRRTCLSIAIAAAVIVRIAAPSAGIAVIALGVGALVATAVAYLSGEQRYRVNTRALRGGRPLADGRALAALALAVLLLATVCVGYLAVRALPG